MRHILIINPVAGKRGDTGALMETAAKLQRQTGEAFTCILTQRPGHAMEKCRAIAETGEAVRFYACGGDGTANEVAAGILGFPNAAMTCVPIGTGNDFIKATGVAAENFMNIEKQINGKSAPIDLIKYNGEICVNICNMGFDANTAMDMPKFRKLPFVSNHLAYYLSLLYNFLKKWGRYMEVYADGELLYNGDTMMCAVGNGISCGGGFYVTPAAKIDDGYIDVSAVSPPEKKKVFKFAKVS